MDGALSEAVERASLGISVLDGQGHLLYSTPWLARLTGRSLAELMGRPAPELAWLNEAGLDDLFWSCLEQERHEKAVVQVAGGPLARWIAMELIPLANHRVAVVSRDVTPDRNREEELFRAFHFMELVLDSMGEGLMETDNKGHITFVNSRAKRLLGWSAEELLGRDLHHLFHGQGPCLEGDECPLAAAAAGLRSFTGEERLMGVDGQHLLVEVTLEPIAYDGVVLGAILLFEEIGQRKRFEQALKEMVQLNSAILSSIPLGIVVLSSQGRIEFANTAFLRLFSVPGDKVQGSDLRKVMGSWLFDDLGLGHFLTLAGEGGEPIDVEDITVVSPTDGREYHYDLTLTPLPQVGDGGGRIVMVLKDVTEAREFEKGIQEAARLETVGRLAGGIAHDYNNIFTGILGLVELALGQVEEGSQLHRDLMDIKSLGQRAQRLNNQLLAFGHRQRLTQVVLDLNALITEKRGLLESVAGENVELVLELEPNLPPVKGDPAQMEQVLFNLVLNACEAMEGRGVIRITTEGAVLDRGFFRSRGIVERPGRYVHLTVSDTGCGIRREHLSRIFEPFFSTKEEGYIKGKGLGLAGVYGILKHHDGYIWVESELGKGTTFEIYLPVAREAASAASERSVVAAAGGDRPTILVVEDEPQVLQVTERMLHHAGFGVITAASPQEALAVAQDKGGELALLLSDIVLPEMDGISLYGKLKRLVPGLKAVFMSGYSDYLLESRGLKGEGAILLEKPFTVGQLVSAINKALERGPGE